jgi:hypothetical protein
LRNLNVKSCLDCARFDSCRGGCPAMAYHTYHDLSRPDPECLVNLKSSRKLETVENLEPGRAVPIGKAQMSKG